MPEKQSEDSSRAISDKAIQARTGKTGAEWFHILDIAGAQTMGHKAIASFLNQEQGCTGWWSQMLAVEYERARGLRVKHETAGGFHVSATRTIAVPVSMAFEAWLSEGTRVKWLPASISIRKANRDKNIRIGWDKGTSNVEVRFYPRGEAKTQVTVDHMKLSDAKSAAKMKVYWAEALVALRKLVEG